METKENTVSWPLLQYKRFSGVVILPYRERLYNFSGRPQLD